MAPQASIPRSAMTIAIQALRRQTLISAGRR
jgi:hypothetical protein